MTSKQVMLSPVLLCLGGCAMLTEPPGDGSVQSPYTTRRIWAVAPLRNESGSGYADGVRIADHLAEQLHHATNVDVLAVNRTIEAMEALQIPQVTERNEARMLMRHLGVDGLVVGTITVYEPYDPPALGLALELYSDDRPEDLATADPRALIRAATPLDEQVTPPPRRAGPTAAIAGVYRASEPHVRWQLEKHGRSRGPVEDLDAWHRHRISMDLYSRFVARWMGQRLLAAEAARFERQAPLPAS